VVKEVRKTKDELLGTSGVASLLGCDYRTIYRHVDAGRLRCVRDNTGRRIFKRADVEAYRLKNKIGNRAVNVPTDQRVH
jgi:excisionase family DNA binding protein